MIDERRRAAAKGRQRADLAADFDAFQRVRPIEPPPDELQNLMKVPRRPRRRRHAGGQRRIQMRVAVHQARHQHRAAAIDNFIARLGNNVRTDADNVAIRDAQIARLDPRRIELNEQRIAKESGHARILNTEETERTESEDRAAMQIALQQL